MRQMHGLPAMIISVENPGCTTVVIEIRTMRTERLFRHDKLAQLDDFFRISVRHLQLFRVNPQLLS